MGKKVARDINDAFRELFIIESYHANHPSTMSSIQYFPSTRLPGAVFLEGPEGPHCPPMVYEH